MDNLNFCFISFYLIRYDNDQKIFNCTNPSSNGGAYCQHADYLDYSLDEIEYGTIDCVTASDNGNYCQAWHHVQKQYQRCWNADDGTGEGTFIEICCNGDTKHLYTCCQQICSTTYYNSQPPLYEYLDCDCAEESASGQYCQRWTCEQYIDESQSKWDAREYENYVCDKSDTDNNFCMNWQGSSHSVKEFEVSKCSCDVISGSGLYCEGWSCQETAVPIWYPNMLWALLPALAGMIGPIFGCSLFCKDLTALVVRSSDGDENTDIRRKWISFCYIYFFCFLVWFGGFLFIAIWKAGIGVLMTIGVIVLVPVPLYLMSMILCHPRSRLKSKQGSSQANAPYYSISGDSNGENGKTGGSVDARQLEASAPYIDGKGAQMEIPLASASYAVPVVEIVTDESDAKIWDLD